MELADILTRDRIRIPLQAESLDQGLQILLELVGPPGDPAQDIARLVEPLRSGEAGVFLSPTPRSRIGVVRGGSGAAAALGVSPHPLGNGEDAPRLLVLVRIASRTRVNPASITAMAEALADPEVESALLTAGTGEEVRSLQRLMKIPLVGRLRVRDALTPLSYRIYPDTPLHEVVDLIARKALPAVPVVGEGLQVLGIITAGEALRQALQGTVQDPGEGGPTARDVMSRSVLCLTEDQLLEDAAQVMVNRDTAQLPVVREGEMVGFLTREAVLRALFTGEPPG
jgi:CBS domain-containing protein